VTDEKICTYKSELSAAVHETAALLHMQGVIDKTTMQVFDDSCLLPSENIAPEASRSIREEA
jgi:putative transcriptional regulator